MTRTRKMHVLIVDDDPLTRLMASEALREGGYTSVEAEDGLRALALFDAERPDLVLTDIFMPEKEGLETISELGLLDPAVRVIAISGGGNMGILNPLPMAAKLGAVRTLAKPFGRRELLEAVAAALEDLGTSSPENLAR